MADYKTKLIEKITESVPMLATVGGFGFAILGLAGGITYDKWLPIPDTIARVFSVAMGIVLITLGFYRSHAKISATVKPHEIGIKIKYPAPGARVNNVQVGGSIEKPVPDGYRLRVFRVFPGSDRMVPLSQARIDIHTNSWSADKCTIGGKPGDQRYFAAFICGKDAEALVSFHNEAVEVHRGTMEAYEHATNEKADFLPAIGERTSDMYECDRVLVTRSQ